MIFLVVLKLFLMKSRAELFFVFQKFFVEIRNQFYTSIHILRSDNALEYLFAPLSGFLSSHEIFINILMLTLHNKMGWLSAKIVT